MGWASSRRSATGVTEFKVGEKASIVRSEIGVSRRARSPSASRCRSNRWCARRPDWSDEESAGATLVYLTAYQAITQWVDLPAKPVTLITGASGGVGVASVHLAKAMGHLVIGSLAARKNPQPFASWAQMRHSIRPTRNGAAG